MGAFGPGQGPYPEAIGTTALRQLLDADDAVRLAIRVGVTGHVIRVRTINVDEEVVETYYVAPELHQARLTPAAWVEAQALPEVKPTGDSHWIIWSPGQDEPEPRLANVDPPPEKGSLYLDYDGNTYRDLGPSRTTVKGLRRYCGLDVQGKTFAVSVEGLPEGARLVWSPTGGPR